MARRFSVYSIMFLCSLLCFAGMDRPQFARAAAPVTPSPAPQAAQVDSDGDDPREELLYHWQDPKFWRDEQRQIVVILVGLALVKIAALSRKAAARTRGIA